MRLISEIDELLDRRLGAARRELLWQMARFVVVGLLNTSITLGAIYLLMYGLGVDYRVANGVGYSLGVVNSFLWSKLWVFGARGGNLMRQVALFLLNFAICYGLQFALLTQMVEHWGWHSGVAQLVAMIFYTALNFVINRSITFKKR